MARSTMNRAPWPVSETVEPEMMSSIVVWSVPLVPLLIVKINVESVVAVPGVYALPIDEDEEPDAPLIR